MTLHEFVSSAATEAGVTEAHIVGPQRTVSVTEARQRAMARAYATGRYSLPQIGRAFNRDHTTVLHAFRKAAALGWLALIFLAIALAASANAEDCKPRDKVIAYLAEQYGEHPVASMLDERNGVTVEMLGNPQTGTGTVLITGANGCSELLAAGVGFQAGPMGEPL